MRAIRLHDTRSGELQPLEPADPSHVGVYACGPTVYSRIHIGNARPYVIFSVLKRFLEHEGYRVAEWLSSHGVVAFVLQYRLSRATGSIYTVEGTELGDMQRAIRAVRSRSKEWSIDPKRVGVMGFSAGGELAALASTRYDAGRPDASDPAERMSSKPDFQALLYPALPHDTRLTAETPRAFLVCGALDRVNISQGLPEFYLALARLHIPAELHVYAGVGHGFGVRSSNPKPVADWPELFLEWMSGQGLLRRP